MKTIIICLLLVVSSAGVFVSLNYGKAKDSKNKNSYSFYKVPLVCSAARSIGCGIKSKPILQEFEKNTSVAEAWLNNTGTIIGIVWKENVTPEERKKIMQTIFKDQKIEAEEIAGKEFDELTKDFDIKKNWLRKNDVDKLSGIESKEIAQRLVDRVNAKTSLSKEVGEKLHDDIAEIINTAFTTMDVSMINKQSESITNECQQKIVDDIMSKAKLILNDAQLSSLKNAINMGVAPVEGEAGYSAEGCCGDMTGPKKCNIESNEDCSNGK